MSGELAVLYYAFASWRSTPDIPEGARAFSTHERAGTAQLFGLLAGLSAIEIPLVHLVVMRWSVAFAWVLTAVSIYGAIWFVAIARSLVLCPILADAHQLVIRHGLLWNLRVPLTAIASYRTGDDPAAFRFRPAGDPTIVLEFSEPAVALGMFGIRRPLDRIALSVDDPDGLIAQLERMRPVPGLQARQ